MLFNSQSKTTVSQLQSAQQWYDNLSDQARALSYMFLFTNACLFVMRLLLINSSTQKDFFLLFLKTISMIVWSCLTVYGIDCATKGGCNQYAWLVVYLNASIVIIYAVLATLILGVKTNALVMSRLQK